MPSDLRAIPCRTSPANARWHLVCHSERLPDTDLRNARRYRGASSPEKANVPSRRAPDKPKYGETKYGETKYGETKYDGPPMAARVNP